MTALTLLASAGFAAVTGLVFAYVGRAVRTRPAAGEEGFALHSFAWWWYGLAGLSAYTAAVHGMAAFGVVNLDLMVAFLYALLLVICAALWGLSYYFVYLFTGRPGWKGPLASWYAVYYLALLYLVQTAGPAGIETTTWSVNVKFEEDLSGSPLSSVLGLLLLLPPLAGAAAYMIVGFRIKDPLIRYRVLLVTGSIVVWFGSSTVASLTGVNSSTWWTLASRLVSLGAAFAILAAFRPPRWIQERVGARPTA